MNGQITVFFMFKMFCMRFRIVGHFEAPPYNPGTLRSAYHVRSCDVFQLKQVNSLSYFRVDICDITFSFLIACLFNLSIM